MGIQQCIILSQGNNNVLSYHKSKGSENGVGGSEVSQHTTPDSFTWSENPREAFQC